MAVVWHAAAESATDWRVDWRAADAGDWRRADAVTRLALADRVVLTATLPVGRSGGSFEYRVSDGAAVLASARGRAPAAPDRPARFVAMGDIGDGSEPQRTLARGVWRAHREAPVDFALVAGDLAYECGRQDEYDRRLFPVFNAAEASAAGAPVMREVPIVATVGNHDVGDLRWPPWPFRCRSDYAFFAFWRHPRGWEGRVPIGPRHRPPSIASGLWPDRPEAADILGASNFAFTWADTHVTVIDSNRYVDWSDAALLTWLERQLEAGRASRWRVVLMHHPPFNRSGHHGSYQWMRALTPMFERQQVTVVFSGHVHNFQWFGPASFTPDRVDLIRFQSGTRAGLRGEVEIQTDVGADGSIDARWPVYIVSGAGNDLLVPDARECPDDLTRVTPAGACAAMPGADGKQASFTLVETGPESMTIRQVSASGETLLERRIRR